MEKAAVKNPVI